MRNICYLSFKHRTEKPQYFSLLYLYTVLNLYLRFQNIIVFESNFEVPHQ